MSRTVVKDLVAPDPELEAVLRGRLDEVEAALVKATASDHPLVAGAASHLLRAGGKRVRPMLVILAGHFGDPADSRLVPAATAIELTHLATLYHDDVIDEAATRRGSPSVNARFDNTVAILAGDFLFARAAAIAAGLGSEVSRLLAETIAQVCEGQIREFDATARLDVSEPEYMGVIERKTASLISASCRLGGVLSGADGVEELARYGEALGLAFQLSDDIMDLISDPTTLGKEPGTDLREGVYTLPVILALQDGEEGSRLRALLESGRPEGERLEQVLELVRSDGTLGPAREAVGRQVRRAIEEAKQLPRGSPREALLHLAEFVATRCGAAV